MPKSAPKSADPKDCLWGAWESWSSCEHMDEHLGVGKFWSWTGRPMRRHSGVPFVNLPNATDLGRSLERSQVNTNGVFRFAFAIEAFDALHFPFASLFIFRARYPGIPLSLCFSPLCTVLRCRDPPILRKDFGGCQRWWKSMHRLAAGPGCPGRCGLLSCRFFFAMEIMEQDLGMRQSHVSRRMPLTVSSLNGLSIAALFIRSLCGIYIECKPRACILPEKVSPHWSWLWQCWYGQIFQISLSTVGLSHQLSSLSAFEFFWSGHLTEVDRWTTCSKSCGVGWQASILWQEIMATFRRKRTESVKQEAFWMPGPWWLGLSSEARMRRVMQEAKFGGRPCAPVLRPMYRVDTAWRTDL